MSLLDENPVEPEWRRGPSVNSALLGVRVLVDIGSYASGAHIVADGEAHGNRVDEPSREIPFAFGCEEVIVPFVVVPIPVAIFPVVVTS